MKWKCHVCKTQIHQEILTLNHSFWSKCQSITHNNASLREKHHLLSSHIKIHWHIWSLFWTVFARKWCFICAYATPDSDKLTFPLTKALLWIEDSYLKKWFKFKNVWMMWCGLFVDYCDVFISCLDSHSHGTHSLQRIHWWAGNKCLIFPNLFWLRNKLIYISDIFL